MAALRTAIVLGVPSAVDTTTVWFRGDVFSDGQSVTLKRVGWYTPMGQALKGLGFVPTTLNEHKAGYDEQHGDPDYQDMTLYIERGGKK